MLFSKLFLLNQSVKLIVIVDDDRFKPFLHVLLTVDLLTPMDIETFSGSCFKLKLLVAKELKRT